jgi:hypothetical protein
MVSEASIGPVAVDSSQEFMSLSIKYIAPVSMILHGLPQISETSPENKIESKAIPMLN